MIKECLKDCPHLYHVDVGLIRVNFKYQCKLNSTHESKGINLNIEKDKITPQVFCFINLLECHNERLSELKTHYDNTVKMLNKHNDCCIFPFCSSEQKKRIQHHKDIVDKLKSKLDYFKIDDINTRQKLELYFEMIDFYGYDINGEIIKKKGFLREYGKGFYIEKAIVQTDKLYCLFEDKLIKFAFECVDKYVTVYGKFEWYGSDKFPINIEVDELKVND